MMNGLFGNITAGAGHDIPSKQNNLNEFRFNGNGMVGRFTDKSQLSVIANGNNGAGGMGFTNMGGNMMGQPDHEALLSTLELNNSLLTGIAKAMNASYAINGIVKYNTLMDDGKTEAALRELEKKLRNSESGFLPMDLKGEFIPLEHKAALVDEATLKFIDEKILRNWGVPLDILTGDYTKEQYEAFYQKTLEPLIVAISQAFTKKMFTSRERAFGNKIALYPKDLIFMTIGQTLEMINILSPTGGLYENEKRVALGLRPLPELEGKRYMSLNWIDANNADKYQVGKVNVDVVDEEKQESVTDE
jgi:hypothetical protein